MATPAPAPRPYPPPSIGLPRLTDILKNINALTPGIHRDSDYTQIIAAVRQRLAN